MKMFGKNESAPRPHTTGSKISNWTPRAAGSLRVDKVCSRCDQTVSTELHSKDDNDRLTGDSTTYTVAGGCSH
ncbi:hypothetical protein [Candidatus Frankia nodulisporulans]|uniref:hypothetical protein n=1 Tax=Candidatus Frankia nodulisporulans TaxID=2060052 RepID=UPI003703F994